MKKTKHTEQQIVFALKQTETETRVDEVCRKMAYGPRAQIFIQTFSN